jgi:hypothetical protein
MEDWVFWIESGLPMLSRLCKCVCSDKGAWIDRLTGNIFDNFSI